MKKFILWLIKIFKVDISTEKVVIETKIVEKEVYLPKDGVIDGDITIKGNIVVTGTLECTGGVTAYCNHELWKKHIEKEV